MHGEDQTHLASSPACSQPVLGAARMALVFAALAVSVVLFASPKKASPPLRAGVPAIPLAIAPPDLWSAMNVALSDVVRLRW